VASPAPADEPGLTAVPASTPAPAPVDEGIPTLFDLRWSPETTDSIDIQGSREVEATLRRLIEPAAGDLEEGHTAEVEPAAADMEEADAAEVEPAAADMEEADTAEVEPAAGDLEEADTAEVEPAAADMEEADTAEVEPAPADMEEADTAEVDRRRIGSLALAAAALAALLIGALLFAVNRDGGVTGQSVPTVTATATATVTEPTSEPSNESADTGGEEAAIQLEDLADTAKPFQTVRIHGTYHRGANTFLRVQRWEAGKWLAFPLPTKTDQSGRFTTHVEFDQRGRYQLRVLDPNSGVTSKPFVLVIKG
jgi:hypothetical protein